MQTFIWILFLSKEIARTAMLYERFIWLLLKSIVFFASLRVNEKFAHVAYSSCSVKIFGLFILTIKLRDSLNLERLETFHARVL